MEQRPHVMITQPPGIIYLYIGRQEGKAAFALEMRSQVIHLPSLQSRYNSIIHLLGYPRAWWKKSCSLWRKPCSLWGKRWCAYFCESKPSPWRSKHCTFRRELYIFCENFSESQQSSRRKKHVYLWLIQSLSLIAYITNFMYVFHLPKSKS